MKKTLAIITARGGSKRIPRKNIRYFLGKPIIQYSIDAALHAGLFTEVMVSTDDQEIADIAQKGGASVPFMRSSKTSDDHATTVDVVLEVLEEYRSRGVEFEYVCCCYPTAPFITAEKLQKAFEMLKTSGADAVIPVARFNVPVWWAMKMEDDRISSLWPEFASKRSQDIPPSYYDCGQFYLIRTEKVMQEKNLVTANTLGMVIPETEVQDIDTVEDWEIAQMKYRFFAERKNSSNSI